MPISEEFAKELDTAVDQVVEDQQESTVEAEDTETKEEEADDGVQSEQGDEEPGSGEGAGEVAGEDAEVGEDTGGAEDGAEGSVGESEETQPEVPAGPVIGDEALALAIRAGISVADARSFPSEKSLLSVVDRIRSG